MLLYSVNMPDGRSDANRFVTVYINTPESYMLPAPSMLYQVTEIMLSATLHQQIIQQLGEQTGAIDWVISGPVIEARECILHKASSPAYPHDVAIKVYRDQKKRKKNAMPQYAALERLSVSMNYESNEYFVPVPYGNSVEHNFFLMEWVEAPTLQYRLWRFFYNKYHQQNDISRTIKWLKCFHQYGGLQFQPVDGNGYVNRLQKIRDTLDVSVLDSNVVFQAGMKCVSDLSFALTNQQVVHAKVHGDFSPQNMLVSDDQITGIDISAITQAPVVEDICLMLTAISIGYPNMLTRSDMKHPSSTWPILKLILEAYDYPKIESQRCFLLFVFLYQLLRRWMVVTHRNRHTPISMLDRMRLRNSEMIVEGVCLTLMKTCHRNGNRS